MLLLHRVKYSVLLLRQSHWNALENSPQIFNHLHLSFKSSASGAPLFSSLASSFVFPPYQQSLPASISAHCSSWSPCWIFSFPSAPNLLFTSSCFRSCWEWSLLHIPLGHSVWRELYTQYTLLFLEAMGFSLCSSLKGYWVTCYEFVFLLFDMFNFYWK